jgi:hypothetical protein
MPDSHLIAKSKHFEEKTSDLQEVASFERFSGKNVLARTNYTKSKHRR